MIPHQEQLLRDKNTQLEEKLIIKTRELGIQTSLEKIREITMAMQRSEEMKEVSHVLLQQMQQSGIDSAACFIIIMSENDSEMEINVANSKAQDNVFYKCGIDDHWVNRKMYDNWKIKKSSFVINLEDKELEDYRLFLKKIGFQLNGGNRANRRTYNMVNFSKGVMGVISDDPLPFDTMHVLERFAKVFDGTYTRFLDLQKAEAQAREAQIELGLERVRARAMAMQKSDELKELIGTVFTELTKLDLVLTRCVIMIYDTKTLGITWWMANSEDPSNPGGLFVKYHQLPPHLAYIKAWRERDLKWQYLLEGKIKKEWDDFLFVETELRHLPDFVIAGMKAPDRVYLNASFNSFGNLTLASLEPLSNEHSDILLRFAKVFDLTYTRFNDLKQAEAQAREAQIELGLERVRARAMAMQKSDELAEAAQLLYHEFGKLGIKTFTCGYMFIDEPNNTQTAWVVLPDGTLLPNFIVFPLTGEHNLDDRYKSWKQKEALHVCDIQGEENKKHHEFLSRHVPASVTEDIFAHIPDRIIFYTANFSDGYLLILSTELFSPREEQTIIRFAKVFEMTYTRFLDLEKAEAQAREAQIELALEHVRARTMTMQKSDELTDVAELLFKQANGLGIKTWTTGFNVWSDDNNFYTDYITNPQGGFMPPYTIDASILPISIKLSNAKKRGDDFYVHYEEGEQLAETYRMLSKFGEKQFKGILESGFEFPASQYEHFVFGAKVSLMFITYEAVPEAHDIFKRFGKVFEQTYTRFLDLQKAEAQAREAAIEASLERVRGKAMSMHSSEDLAATIHVFYHEMESLSVTPRRCGVGLLNKKTRIAELSSMNTTEQGESIEVIGKLKLTGHPVLEGIYDNWISQKEYHPVLRGNEIKKYYQLIRPQIAYPDYPTDTAQYGYFFFFKRIPSV
jgi:DNA-directed RNA polymerase subunit N (RpoN/RPB10)